MSKSQVITLEVRLEKLWKQHALWEGSYWRKLMNFAFQEISKKAETESRKKCCEKCDQSF